MIVDVRTYTLVPRRMKAYLEIYEEHGLPVMRRHLGEPLGYFVSIIGGLNQVVHLWGYDSLADMEKRRAARDADPAWAEYLTMTDGLVQAQHNSIMRPTDYSGIK